MYRGKIHCKWPKMEISLVHTGYCSKPEGTCQAEATLSRQVGWLAIENVIEFKKNCSNLLEAFKVILNALLGLTNTANAP